MVTHNSELSDTSLTLSLQCIRAAEANRFMNFRHIEKHIRLVVTTENQQKIIVKLDERYIRAIYESRE